jgi:PhnB protein
MSEHPETPNGVIAYLTMADANAAIKFYTEAFGATELFRMPHDESGKIMHATIAINSGQMYLSDDFPEMSGAPSTPSHFGGSPVTLHMKVDDVDAVVAKAVEHGAEILFPVADMFWGDRCGKIRDPSGHHRSIATTLPEDKRKELAKQEPNF